MKEGFWILWKIELMTTLRACSSKLQLRIHENFIANLIWNVTNLKISQIMSCEDSVILFANKMTESSQLIIWLIFKFVTFHIRLAIKFSWILNCNFDEHARKVVINSIFHRIQKPSFKCNYISNLADGIRNLYFFMIKSMVKQPRWARESLSQRRFLANVAKLSWWFFWL